MTFSNQSLLLGAIYEMTLAGLSSARFAIWQPAFARTWESLRAIAGSLSGALSEVEGLAPGYRQMQSLNLNLNN